MVPSPPHDSPEEPELPADEPATPPETNAGEAPPAPEPPSTTAPRPRPKPRPDVPAEPPPPEPPSTQLAHSDKADTDPELARKLERASLLLGSIAGRSLTPELTEQLTAARAFVAQARQALADGDERRALVLIDKGVILAEDVERMSRP
jgi:hypothetical protein